MLIDWVSGIYVFMASVGMGGVKELDSLMKILFGGLGLVRYIKGVP